MSAMLFIRGGCFRKPGKPVKENFLIFSKDQFVSIGTCNLETNCLIYFTTVNIVWLKQDAWDIGDKNYFENM